MKQTCLTCGPVMLNATRWVRRVVGLAVVAGPAMALAAPNLVRNGELDFPPEAAPARVSDTGNEAIFEFQGEKRFGRVVARGTRLGNQ